MLVLAGSLWVRRPRTANIATEFSRARGAVRRYAGLANFPGLSAAASPLLIRGVRFQQPMTHAHGPMTHAHGRISATQCAIATDLPHPIEAIFGITASDP
jgi:hypothetical protein